MMGQRLRVRAVQTWLVQPLASMLQRMMQAVVDRSLMEPHRQLLPTRIPATAFHIDLPLHRSSNRLSGFRWLIVLHFSCPLSRQY